MAKQVDFLIASLLTGYPDEHFAEYIETLLSEPELSISESLRESICLLLKDNNKLNDLRSQYIDLFDRGPPANSLYETEYGRGRAMVKGSELADLSGFYKAFGFEMSDQAGEMVDHLSVEFEFYTLLLMKQNALEDSNDQEGIETVLDARKKFLKDHLGRFTGTIAHCPGVLKSSFYSSVFKFCHDLTRQECEQLGITVEPVDLIASEAETGDISCGGFVGFPKG